MQNKSQFVYLFIFVLFGCFFFFFFFFTFYARDLKPSCLLISARLCLQQQTRFCLYSLAQAEIKMCKLSLLQQSTSVQLLRSVLPLLHKCYLSISTPHYDLLKQMFDSNLNPLPLETNICSVRGIAVEMSHMCERCKGSKQSKGGRGGAVGRGRCREAGASVYSQTGCFGILSPG